MKRLAECLLPLRGPDGPRKPGLMAEQVAEFVPSLVAAVEAVLKEADEWDADAAELDRDIARARKSPHASDHAQARTDEALAGELRGCATKLREAITAALTGEEASDGPQSP
jgi:hypothetical protein